MLGKQKAIAFGLCFALATGVVLYAPHRAFADPQDDLDAANERLEEVTAELEASQASLSEAAERLSTLGQELEISEANLESATEKLEQTAYEVQVKELEVTETTENLAHEREVLSATMRSGYKVGSAQFIEFLLGSTSIDDFINRVYYMDKVNQQEAQTISEVETLEAQLEAEQAELEAQQAEEAKMVEELQAQVTSYNEAVAEAQAYYEALDEDVQKALAEQAEAQQAAEEASYMVEVYEAMKRQEEQRRAQEAAEAQARAEAEAEAQRQAEQQAQRQAEQQAQQQQQQQQSQQQSQQQTDVVIETETQTQESSSSEISASVYAAVQTAYAQVGKPYVYGASGPNSFDCSGLVIYCYGNKYGHGTGYMISGIKAAGNWKTSLSELKYGDLVFPSSGHVGIYIGNNQMIHAANPSQGVVITSVYSFYGGGSY